MEKFVEYVSLKLDLIFLGSIPIILLTVFLLIVAKIELKKINCLLPIFIVFLLQL